MPAVLLGERAGRYWAVDATLHVEHKAYTICLRWLEASAPSLLCVTSLFAIINPLSATSVYLALTDGYAPKRRRQTLHTAVLTAAGVLVLFKRLGGMIFQLFGITMGAFRIAGGIIIFAIGLDILEAKRPRGKATNEEEQDAMQTDDVAVAHLGGPMIVGAGAITTVFVPDTRSS